jgi:hypothetical protein
MASAAPETAKVVANLSKAPPEVPKVVDELPKAPPEVPKVADELPGSPTERATGIAAAWFEALRARDAAPIVEMVRTQLVIERRVVAPVEIASRLRAFVTSDDPQAKALRDTPMRFAAWPLADAMKRRRDVADQRAILTQMGALPGGLLVDAIPEGASSTVRPMTFVFRVRGGTVQLLGWWTVPSVSPR